MQTDEPITVCHECDLILRGIRLRKGQVATCIRCGANLYKYRTGSLNKSLALLCAASIAFLIANFYPIVTIETQGQYRSASLYSAINTLWHEDMPIVSALVFVTTLLAPACEIFTMTFILAATTYQWHVPYSTHALRFVVSARPWSMVEVFMLGVLVSVVKLSHLAHIIPGIALWSYGALIILFASAIATLDIKELWDRLAPEK